MIQKVIFNDDEINQIKGYTKEWSDSGIHNKGYLPEARQSLQSHIDCELIEPIILPKLKEYNIKSITGEILVLQYNKGHFFKRHQDRLDPNPKTTNRQQTLIVQLSDENDYEGGELVVRDIVVDKTKGNMVLFDSNEWHELKELTSGTRYCLVVWLPSSDYNKNKLF